MPTRIKLRESNLRPETLFENDITHPEFFVAYYVHMQEAYASEKAEIGTWTQIGYTEPASNVFSYTNGEKGTNDFDAATKSALDGVSGSWTVGSSIDANTGRTTHTSSMPTGADKLTPNFTMIGKTGTPAAGNGD